MKIKRKASLYFLVIILSSSLFSNYRVFAQSPTLSPSPTTDPSIALTPTPTNSPSNDAQRQQLNDKIRELEGKISDLKKQENSLSSQIDMMDNQIQLTQYRINVVQEQINDTTLDIDTAGKKIKNLEGSLNNVTKVLLSRIVATYQAGEIEPVRIMLASSNLQEFLSRENYLKIVQEHDKQLLYNTQQAKVDYANQKTLLESKKKKIVALQVQLDEYNKELDQEKVKKQELLDITKNDEKEYQKQLAQALAEKQAIDAALISGVKEGPVKTGEPIALVGNTGYPSCSTGPHLHFEIRKNNQWENPANYLKSKSVLDDQGSDQKLVTLGSGEWEWPLSDQTRITQFYGHTPYSWRYTYSGGIHTGLDMVSDASNVIRAPKDGILYSSSEACGSATIKIKYIEHGDGVVSFYLHVQ